MNLTPLEIEQKDFPTTALGGYRKEAVQEFLTMVAATLQVELEHSRQLDIELKQLKLELARFREKEQQINNILLLAQTTAEDRIDAANAKSQAIIEEAQQQAAKMQRGHADIEAKRRMFATQFYVLLQTYLKSLEFEYPELREQVKSE